MEYGGPNGEMNAAMRYLSQRFHMKDNVAKGILTDIGTEELAHLEMVGTVVHQLTKNVPDSQIENSPFAAYYIDHGKGVYPQSAGGTPNSQMAINVMGDAIADLNENLAAEQKARAVYENILKVSDDADVNRVMKYLREREIVHFQRFGEAKRKHTSKSKKPINMLFFSKQKYKSYDVER